MKNSNLVTTTNPRKKCEHTYHACALRLMEKSSVEQHVEMRKSEMWKSRVNAITWPVHS